MTSRGKPHSYVPEHEGPIDGEVWRALIVSPRHEISNFGRLRSWVLWGARSKQARAVTPRIMRLRVDRAGYLRVCIVVNDKKRLFGIHKLVLDAFVGQCPSGLQARHINGNPADNRVENLGWCTSKENHADRRTHGTMVGRGTGGKGMRNPGAVKDLEIIKQVLRTKGTASGRQVASDFGLEHKTVYKIWNGEHWTQLAGLVPS